MHYLTNKITVYTPTYNRGYCLHKLYHSLKRQSCPSDQFKWLIVDDGSTDNTGELVRKWMNEADFEIIYHEQPNEGKMKKLNFIHQILDTELCTCIDSDDYLTDNAIEIIFREWERLRHDSSLAGLIALDHFKDGKIVGTPFPKGLKRIKYSDFDGYGVKGDKKFVYRSRVISSYPPYPSFIGERFPAPGYLYRLIDQDYDLAIVNEPLCIVEYLPDGLSKNKYEQFRKAPNSFMFYRQERMRLSKSFGERFRNAVHYVSSCMFARKNILVNNKYPFITLAAFPFGVLLHFYLKTTNKKGVINEKNK